MFCGVRTELILRQRQLFIKCQWNIELKSFDSSKTGVPIEGTEEEKLTYFF